MAKKTNQWFVISMVLIGILVLGVITGFIVLGKDNSGDKPLIRKDNSGDKPLISNEPTTLEGYNSQLDCSYNQAGNLECVIESTEFFIVKLDFEELQGMGVSNCKEYTEKLVGSQYKIGSFLGKDIYKLTDALTFCNKNTNNLYIGLESYEIDKLIPYFDKFYI